ncbi:hypothetical protein [Coprococcus sp. RTP21281st1_F1_RTP21281_210402]|uniref:hypothetical protein n=1 Tax=Coprococcus sp. RTP21281st1_F1_RTP21281_210402 TaxID=3143208 RepID=UPI0034A37156
MAQLGNLLVTGSSRLLGKLFCNDISVGNELTVKTLNTTDFTANSIITSGLTVNGNTTTTGTLNVGNSQANGKISINGKVVIRDYANNGWLGINDTLAWTNGVYFGKTTVRTDGIFQVGDAGNKVLFNQSSAKFTVPVTINNSLAANNITATNVTVNGKLVAYQQEIRTIQDLGGEFCVSPTIYIQKASKTVVNVKKIDSTTISISIKDEKAITSNTIQGVKWAKGSKIKIQSKIDGIVIKGDGTMTNTLNTDQYTMAIDVVVDSSIANHFSTEKNNASFDEINIMLYQRYGKKIGSTTENVYSPVGIRMSATGSTNAAPYLDIWGSKSSSDPDTVYTVPSVRLGYLDGLKCGTYDCFGYGLYADNVYLNGTIISNSGQLGGFKIGTNDLSNGTWGTDKSVLMSTGTTENKAVGGSSAISGWCFTAGSKFGVTTSGDLYASNANISGIVTSENGKIGGFTISQYNIKGTNVGLGCASGHDYAFWAGNSTGSSAPFRVDHDGTLTATNASITGTITSDNITATGGTIGGWVITSDDIQGSNTYDGTLYTIGLKNVTTGGSSSFTISDQDFIYSDLTSNSETVRTIAIKPVGQIHLQGISTSGMPGYTILDNNGIQVSSLDQKLILFKSHLISNNPTSSTNSFYIYSQNILSHHIQLADEEYTNLINTSYGIYCSKDAFFGGSTEFGNWKISNTRIASSNTISMGAKEAGIMIVNEKDKPYVLVQNSSGDSLFSIEKNGSITHNGNTIGQTYVNSFTDNKAISNAVWANTGANITLPAGTYVIMGSVHFANAKGGRRAIRFASGSTGLAYSEQIVPVDSNATINSALQCQWIISPTSQTTYNLQAFQASGGRINMTSSYIKAVRIA